MPTDLVAVQTFLVDALRRQTPTPNDPTLASTAALHVAGNDRFSPAEQVELYRQQFFLRHERVLGEDYPGLERVLGREATQRLFRRYLEAFPPSTPLLRDLGTSLPGFVERYDALPVDKRDLAIEMARYETAIVAIFDGVDVPALDPDKLATMNEDAWNTARIVLHPLLTRFAFSYPVHRLRVAIKNGEDVTLPDAPSPVHLAVFRSELITRYEELEPEAYELLGALGAGMPLVPALERIAEQLSDERKSLLAANIGGWFRTWTAWGIIVDIVPDGLASAER